MIVSAPAETRASRRAVSGMWRSMKCFARVSLVSRKAASDASPDASAAAAAFVLGPTFRALEEAKASLGIETFTLSQTTLEQVFLNISAKQVEDEP